MGKRAGGNTPHHVFQLTKDDTIVYSIGLHVGNRNSIYNTLDKFGRALLSQERDRPKLVYMNTITQHFPTATGRFAGHMIHLPPDQFSCTANVSTNPLLDTELVRLQASVNVAPPMRNWVCITWEGTTVPTTVCRVRPMCLPCI
jgi:hypothetical protein